MNKKLKAKVALITLLVFVIGTRVLAPYVFTYNEQATVGDEEQIAVWLDAGKTIELQSGQTLNWNTVFRGSNFKSYWIENVGTLPVNLTLNVGGNLPSGWAEAWDYDGSTLLAGAVLQVTLTLTVPDGTPKATYNWSGSTITTIPA